MVVPSSLFFFLLLVTRDNIVVEGQLTTNSAPKRQCVRSRQINGNEGTSECGDSCYYLVLEHTEGTVEGFGCTDPATIPSELKMKMKQCGDFSRLNNMSQCLYYEPEHLSLCCCVSRDNCNNEWINHPDSIHRKGNDSSTETFYYTAASFSLSVLAWISPLASILFMHTFFKQLKLMGNSLILSIVFNLTQIIKIIVGATAIYLYYVSVHRICDHHPFGSFIPSPTSPLDVLPPSLSSSYSSIVPSVYLLFIVYTIYLQIATGRVVYRCWQFVVCLFAPSLSAVFSLHQSMLYMEAISNDNHFCRYSNVHYELSLIILICLFAIEPVSGLFFLVYHFFPYKKSQSDLKSLISNREAQVCAVPWKAHSNVTHLDEKEPDPIKIEPYPFIAKSSSEEVLTITNMHHECWFTMRVLVSAPERYQINPRKVLLPPGRKITIGIKFIPSSDEDKMNTSRGREEHSLLLEWFVTGKCAPSREVASYWTKPYPRPRDQWFHCVVPIFHDDDDDDKEPSRESVSSNKKNTKKRPNKDKKRRSKGKMSRREDVSDEMKDIPPGARVTLSTEHLENERDPQVSTTEAGNGNWTTKEQETTKETDMTSMRN